MPLHVGVAVHNFSCCFFQEIMYVLDFTISFWVSGTGLDVFEC